ncbi:hypothetical protein ACFXTI_037779 [Malus domestica]
MMKKYRTTSSFMQSIFDAILLKILIIVASNSLRDLFSVKMVLKKFKKIAEDHHIYQHINITTLRLSTDLDHRARLTLSQPSSIAASNATTPRPFTWWGCDTSSETTRKKPKFSGLRDSKHVGLKLLYSLNRQNSGQLSVMECQEIFRLCLSGFWVYREVRARI